MEENSKKIKYFLIKIEDEYDESRDTMTLNSWHQIPKHLKFEGTADTVEEAEKWAEKAYVPDRTTPFAIKGEVIHFNVDRKVSVETKAMITSEDKETASKLEEINFWRKNLY